MRFAIIGGAGFIGSHITKKLSQSGHETLVIDNLHSGKKENLDNINNLKFIETDVRNFEMLNEKLENVDGIFHEAGLTDVQESFAKPEEYYDVNVTGIQNVFKIAQKNNLKVVFASSASVYGDVENTPIKENTSKNPINPYGETKVKGEEIAQNFIETGNKIVGLRYFNVFGKGQTMTYAGVITKFLDRIIKNQPPIIFGDGKQIRDFVHVNDIVDANIHAMTEENISGFFNIGTGIPTSIEKLAKIMVKISEKEFEPIFQEALEGDIRKSIADTSYTEQHLGWKSKIRLEEGLRTLIERL